MTKRESVSSISAQLINQFRASKPHLEPIKQGKKGTRLLNMNSISASVERFSAIDEVPKVIDATSTPDSLSIKSTGFEQILQPEAAEKQGPVPPPHSSRLPLTSIDSGNGSCHPSLGVHISPIHSDNVDVYNSNFTSIHGKVLPPSLTCENPDTTPVSKKDTVSADSCFGSQADSSSPQLSRHDSLRIAETDDEIDDEEAADKRLNSLRIKLNISGTIFEVSR